MLLFLSVITRFAVGFLGCLEDNGSFYVVDRATCRVDDMNAVFNGAVRLMERCEWSGKVLIKR